MLYTNNNNVNYGKVDVDELTNNKINNPDPAWQKIIEDKEFIIAGSILIVNGLNISDAAYASRKNFDVTLVDFQGNNNQIEEMLSAFPKIKFLDDDVFSLNGSLPDTFDFVYETAINLIDEPERKNYLKKLSGFIKTGGRLITIFELPDKNPAGQIRNNSPVQYKKNMPDFMKLEFSSKYSVSNNSKEKIEVLQVYYKRK